MEDVKCHFVGKAMKMARAKIEAKKGGEQGVPSRMVWYYVEERREEVSSN